VIEGFLDLVDEVQRQAPLVASADHGDHHWRLVAWVGAELLEEIGGGDPVVVLLFALFHDSQRESEYNDPEHAPRGAALANRLLNERGLDMATIDKVDVACSLHTEADPTTDLTLGICWDSDRLNLWRVGIEPNPAYLSTSAARKPQRIGWAETIQDEEPTWAEIEARYCDIERHRAQAKSPGRGPH